MPMDQDRDEYSVRLRVACDRCHSQKLRCPKVAEAEKCNRCSKAQTLCVFSPFRQKKEPRNKSPRDGASMDVQLARREKRIGTVTENNRNAIAKFDAKVGAGSKRKRTASVQRDTDYPTPEDTTPDVSSAYPNPALCISDSIATSFDWTSSSFPMFNDFEPVSTFDDLDMGLGNIFPLIDFTTPISNHESQGVNTKELFQLPAPRGPYFDTDSPSPQVDRAPAALHPIYPRRKSRALEIGWENHISTNHPHSEKHLVRQLSQLSIGLYDHIGTIPPQSIHDNDPRPFAASAAIQEGDTTARFTGYSLDETFKLTQDLIDIYPVFIDTFLKGRSSRSEAPSCYNVDTRAPNSHASTPQDDLEETNMPLHAKVITPHPGVRQDHASILLLLSCHVRVIDIYDELFKHMAVCMSDREFNNNEMEKLEISCQIPNIKIGTYTPPPSASIPMQMMLLVHLAAQLSDDAAELAAHLRGPSDEYEKVEDNPNNGAIDEAMILSLATAEKVKGRASNMSQQLSKARMMILNQGRFA